MVGLREETPSESCSWRDVELLTREESSESMPPPLKGIARYRQETLRTRCERLSASDTHSSSAPLCSIRGGRGGSARPERVDPFRTAVLFGEK